MINCYPILIAIQIINCYPKSARTAFNIFGASLTFSLLVVVVVVVVVVEVVVVVVVVVVLGGPI